MPSLVEIFADGPRGPTAVTMPVSVIPQTGTSRHESSRLARSASGRGIGAPPQIKTRSDVVSWCGKLGAAKVSARKGVAPIVTVMRSASTSFTKWMASQVSWRTKRARLRSASCMP